MTTIQPHTKLYHLPNHRTVELGDDATSMLVFCLRIAAERFVEHANTCGVPLVDGEPQATAQFSRIAQQFQHQAEQAQELATRIEDAEYLKLGKVREDSENDS